MDALPFRFRVGILTQNNMPVKLTFLLSLKSELCQVRVTLARPFDFIIGKGK